MVLLGVNVAGNGSSRLEVLTIPSVQSVAEQVGVWLIFPDRPGIGGSDERLLSDDLIKLPHLLGLSRQPMRAIRQNLIFSLSVLAIAVGLNIPGILLPVTGALLHELSSISVIANSARLIGVKDQI